MEEKEKSIERKGGVKEGSHFGCPSREVGVNAARDNFAHKNQRRITTSLNNPAEGSLPCRLYSVP